MCNSFLRKQSSATIRDTLYWAYVLCADTVSTVSLYAGQHTDEFLLQLFNELGMV